MTTPAEPEGDKPGKIRTWWHPLLSGFLRWQLGSHYELFEEVTVGKKPLQIDFLLLHKLQRELSAKARKIIVIAPHLSKPYEDEMCLLGMTPRLEQPGIWKLESGPLRHPVWLLETSILAGRDHPVLTLVNPQILRPRAQIYDELHQAGYTELVVYMGQQIQQFRHLGKEFSMQHFGSEDEMLQAMRALLASLPVEERIEGLSPEQLLSALSPEEREHLKELLQQQTKADDASAPN
jgi:hypothetical protein